MDYVQILIYENSLSVLVLTESWLSPKIPNNDISIRGWPIHQFGWLIGCFISYFCWQNLVTIVSNGCAASASHSGDMHHRFALRLHTQSQSNVYLRYKLDFWSDHVETGRGSALKSAFKGHIQLNSLWQARQVQFEVVMLVSNVTTLPCDRLIETNLKIPLQHEAAWKLTEKAVSVSPMSPFVVILMNKCLTVCFILVHRPSH